MKRNNKRRLHIVLLTAGCILLASICLVRFWRYVFIYDCWAWDLDLRINELACSHDGVDPFDIFEKKIKSDKYTGFLRPDKPDERSATRKYVHAYPAWHTALFWWYGLVPRSMCIAVMLCLYGLALAYSCKWTAETMEKKDGDDGIEDILFLVAMMILPFTGIGWTLNYGLLLLGCMLLLFRLLEKKKEILAGILFSVIMIKPQVGTLLLIPLFLNRYYKTIAVAGAICILETLFTAWQLDKSPVELILQIPQIGAPFYKGAFTETAIKVFGKMGPFLIMAVFAGLTAVGCFLLRNVKEIWVRFLPALAFIPFWTYSQSHDWFIILPCYVYLLNDRWKYPRLYELCFCLAILWTGVTFCFLKEWYSIGKQGTASVLHLGLVSIICCMAILDNEDARLALRECRKVLIGKTRKKDLRQN